MYPLNLPRSALTAAVLGLCIGVTWAQSPTTSPETERWSSFLPSIQGCRANPPSAILDDGRGRISQVLNYISAFPPNDGDVIVADTGQEVGDPLDCGQISVEMTLPFAPPPRDLSKKEIEAERKQAKRMKKNQKKFNQLLKISAHPKASPPPRLFQIKGFEAYQYFSPRSDCIGCDDFRFTTISVQFSKDKKLTARLTGTVDQVVTIIESIDFNRLNDSMERFANTRK